MIKEQYMNISPIYIKSDQVIHRFSFSWMFFQESITQKN